LQHYTQGPTIKHTSRQLSFSPKTDNDLIEKSNLNRQFLFRPNDIQKPKSTAATLAAKAINPDLNVEAALDRMGPKVT